MVTPLTGSVRLTNVLVRPSLSTDETVLPGVCRLDLPE